MLSCIQYDKDTSFKANYNSISWINVQGIQYNKDLFEKNSTPYKLYAKGYPQLNTLLFFISAIRPSYLYHRSNRMPVLSNLSGE